MTDLSKSTVRVHECIVIIIMHVCTHVFDLPRRRQQLTLLQTADTILSINQILTCSELSLVLQLPRGLDEIPEP